eukprot:Skav219899  [mRNA]  locus=scaffold841:210630:212576:+ [translate_table: standard]
MRGELNKDEIDLSGLSSKALTLLMQGKHTEEGQDFKVRRKDRKHVKAFLKLTRPQRHEVLSRNEVWVYRADKGFRNQDILLIENSGIADDALFGNANLGEAEVEEEEVDWDGDTDSEEEGDEGEEVSGDEIPLGPADNHACPPLKRLRGKRSEPLLEDGWTAVIGTVDTSCHTSQELSCPIYCCGFGQQLVKPAVLRRWGVLHTTCDSIQILAGRENGNMYYAARPLEDSPSAKWLLQNAGSLEKAYCRLHLLLSTLERGTMAIFPAKSEPEVKNDALVDPRDGMAEFAKAHRLISAADFLRGVYKPWQFRGIVKLFNEEGITALVKGMLVINPKLTGEILILPDSCIRVRGPHMKGAQVYGLDLTTSTRPMAAPRLTPFLLAMLRARVHLVPDKREKKALELRVSRFVYQCKEYIWNKFQCRSFGFDEEVCAEAKSQVLYVSGEKEPKDKWPEKRADVHSVQLKIGTGKERPTPLSTLEVEEEEHNPHFLSHRTRDSLARGSVALWGNYKNQRRKPRLHIPHTGATVTALSDYTGTLEDRTCIVVTGGKVITGPVLVWRCPCQCPWDRELWTAVEIEDREAMFGEAGVPTDVVIISRKGLGNSRGGDYDGDLDMLSWHPTLVYIASKTQTVVDRSNVENFDLQDLDV